MQNERTQINNELRLQEGRQKTKYAHSDLLEENANSTFQKAADQQLELFTQEMLGENHKPLEEPSQDILESPLLEQKHESRVQR